MGLIKYLSLETLQFVIDSGSTLKAPKPPKGNWGMSLTTPPESFKISFAPDK